MKASDFAGHCMEVTAWRILRDISRELLSRPVGHVVRPDLIAIADDQQGFTLVEASAESIIDGFDAPEVETTGRTSESSVWALGASLFFVMMGRQVMNGRGGRRQTAQSPIPYLRNSLPRLSEIVRQCLLFTPNQRPSMQTLNKIATEQYKLCVERIRQGPPIATIAPSQQYVNSNNTTASEFWPEQMIPIAPKS